MKMLNIATELLEEDCKLDITYDEQRRGAIPIKVKYT